MSSNRHPMIHMRTPRGPVERVPLSVGDRVRFDGETYRVRWTVRAVSGDGRWAILTKPHNLARTVLYTIIDFDDGVRGPDNMVFSIGYETAEAIATNMARLEAGDMEVSVRSDAPLRIAEVAAR